MLDVLAIAEVEVSSADEIFPIEKAFLPEPSLGWRAAEPGPQTIRLLFHCPVRLYAVRLHFIERAAERTQQTILSLQVKHEAFREVDRRQFAFSPAAATEDTELVVLDANDVTALDLRIEPEIAEGSLGSGVFATLASMQLLAAGDGRP